MKKEHTINPLLTVFAIWIICFLFRILDYFIFKTDQTIIGEAFVHKLVGIFLIFLSAKILVLNIKEIGFSKKGIIKGFCKGLVFGILTYVIAYIVEIFILIKQGNACRFDFFIISYSAEGNIIRKKEFVLFFVCIIGNIINVLMEEGMFRGVFQKVLEKKYSFIIAAIVSSIFFGIWHIIAPLRSLFSGLITTKNFIETSVILIIASTLVGFKFAMMTKITGNLYMAMGDHFLNNTIGNILHILSKGINQPTVIDSLSFIRIGTAQTISFIIILIWFIAKKHSTESKDRVLGA